MFKEFFKKLKTLSLVFALGFGVLSFNELSTNKETTNNTNYINNVEEDNINHSYNKMYNPFSSYIKILTNVPDELAYTTIPDSYSGGNIMTTFSCKNATYRLPNQITCFMGTTKIVASSLTDSVNGFYYNATNGRFGITPALQGSLNSGAGLLTISIFLVSTSDTYWSDEGVRSTSLSLKDSSQDNSSTNPYLIKDGKDFGYLSYATNFLNVFDDKTLYLELANNIDLDGHYFVPINAIGKENIYFDLEGNNKVISNLKFLITDDFGSECYYGLFGLCYGKQEESHYLSLTSISNLTLKNINYSFGFSDFTFYNLYIGSLCGLCEINNINNIFIDGFNFECPSGSTITTAKNFYFGGFMGKYEGYTITNIEVILENITLNLKTDWNNIGGFCGCVDLSRDESGNNKVFNNIYLFYSKNITINSYLRSGGGTYYIGAFIGSFTVRLECFVNNILVTTTDGFNLANVITFNHYSDSEQYKINAYFGGLIGYLDEEVKVTFYNCEVNFKSDSPDFKAISINENNSASTRAIEFLYGNIIGFSNQNKPITIVNSSFFIDSVNVTSLNSNNANAISSFFGGCLNSDEIADVFYNVYTETYEMSEGNKNPSIEYGQSHCDDSELLKNAVISEFFTNTLFGNEISYYVSDAWSNNAKFTPTTTLGELTSSNFEVKKNLLNTNKNTAANLTAFGLSTTDLLDWGTDSLSGLTLKRSVNLKEHYKDNGDVTTEVVDFNQEKVVSDPESKSGKVFAGWYYDKDFINPLTNLNTTKKLVLDTDIYAKYVDGVTISFETNGGSAKDSIAGLSGGSIDLKDNPTKDGYNFAGWYYDADCTQEFTSSVYPDSSLTLYAKWTQNTPVIVFPHPTFNITYVTNGGVINDTSYPTTYKTGDIIVLPSDVTKASATFLGWYEHENFSGSAVTNLSQFAMGDFTFYAKWSVSETPSIEHKITYILNNGTILDSTYATSFIEGVGTTNIPTNVTLDGFTFDGWYDNKDFTGSAIKEIGSDVKSDVTLYAKFTKNEEKEDNNNNNNWWWLLLLLLIPVIGLIIWLILHNKKKKEEAK